MTGLAFGMGAGVLVKGEWWSLIAFCAIVSASIGAWRNCVAYHRLGGGFRRRQDAYNLALTGGFENPEDEAARILDGGRLPPFRFVMLLHASAWEFVGCVIAAIAVRLVLG